MQFHHWTCSPIVQLKDIGKPQTVNYKPKGFWFDVDNDWARWCIAEDFRLSNLRYRHEIHFGKANVLHMSTAMELDRFTEQYMAQIYPTQELHSRFCGIDWPTVAKKHDGIVIAPYLWSRRMDLMWYYGWDCASGCIWNIEHITFGPEEEMPFETLKTLIEEKENAEP